MRQFSSGATRDSDENKLDFDGFLSPQAIEATERYLAKIESLAWAAGLFEGEGSITHSKSTQNGRTYITPRLAMSLTDYDVINRFQVLLGGTLRGPYQKRLDRKPIWYWQAGKTEGIKILTNLYPFLGVRRQQMVLEKFGIRDLAKICNLSPLAIEAYGNYMHKNRKQADGQLRASDNWQKGIPQDAYMKSMWRHFFAVWKGFRADEDINEDLCALFFNVQGLLHERLKGEKS